MFHPLDNQLFFRYYIRDSFGGIAQLGECLTGSQEVTGSSPVISTIE